MARCDEGFEREERGASPRISLDCLCLCLCSRESVCRCCMRVSWIVFHCLGCCEDLRSSSLALVATLVLLAPSHSRSHPACVRIDPTRVAARHPHRRCTRTRTHTRSNDRRRPTAADLAPRPLARRPPRIDRHPARLASRWCSTLTRSPGACHTPSSPAENEEHTPPQLRGFALELAASPSQARAHSLAGFCRAFEYAGVRAWARARRWSARRGAPGSGRGLRRELAKRGVSHKRRAGDAFLALEGAWYSPCTLSRLAGTRTDTSQTRANSWR